MSTAPQYNPHYTLDDYQQWEGDWELWNGVAVAMTPSPFGRHAHLLAQLAKLLGNAIDDSECDDPTVLIEIDWIISNDTVVRPDLTIVCGGAPERHVENTPALVVEILSASTRERDLTVKRELYQAQAVRWYLIVDPDHSSLEAYELGGDGVYESIPFADTLEITVCDQCVLYVRVDRLFE